MGRVVRLFESSTGMGSATPRKAKLSPDDTVADLKGQPHLEHLSDKVLDDYEEKAQDTNWLLGS
jgi:hypothetical protein